jgi:hypothetical protein
MCTAASSATKGHVMGSRPGYPTGTTAMGTRPGFAILATVHSTRGGGVQVRVYLEPADCDAQLNGGTRPNGGSYPPFAESNAADCKSRCFGISSSSSGNTTRRSLQAAGEYFGADIGAATGLDQGHLDAKTIL